MATVIGHSELAQRAFKYIEEKWQENPAIDRQTLLDEAGMRFNLGPLDAAALARLLPEQAQKSE